MCIRSRAWPVAAVALVFASACTASAGVSTVGVDVPVPTVAPTPTTPEPTTTPTPSPTPGPTPEGPPIDLGLAASDIAGLITPSGIPVAVLAAVDESFLVRTPCGNTALVAGGEPIGPTSVILDAGHGGPIDTGTVGPNGVVESDLNLTLAVAVEDELVDRGISVAPTRTGDYPVLLSVRSEFADDLGAEIMVSIHHNAPVADPSDTPGTEVFVQTGSPQSARLGGLVFEEVTAALSRFDIAWTTAPDAGVLRVLLEDGRDAYGMIRRPETPTALVELGYLAHEPEAELFTTDEYLAVAAVALADAVEAHLETDRPGTGFGNPPRTFRPNLAPGADVCVEPPLG